MKQGMAYCHGYGAQVVQWHVLFAAGDYKGSGPVYKKFKIQFSMEEIVGNWRMILNNSPDARELGYVET